MKIGIVGLGRMGGNLAVHATEKGHAVVGYARSARTRNAFAREGLDVEDSLETLVARLDKPRIVLIYVPHGSPTEEVCGVLRNQLEPGDIVADGGNSHWADSKRRHHLFAEDDIRFLDIGTSGGVSGARTGACFMVGGDRRAFSKVAPLLKDLAVDSEGVLFAGPPGAGHFVKLVHNAIEFGMVQSIAEGVEALMRSELPIDLPALFNNWMHGSVIRSWLVELMGHALTKRADFTELSTYVEDTGEVKWFLEWAMQEDIPTPVISASQMALMEDRDLDMASAKAVALLRNQYGGHPVHLVSHGKARR